jgi:hypothetical protein
MAMRGSLTEPRTEGVQAESNVKVRRRSETVQRFMREEREKRVDLTGGLKGVELKQAGRPAGRLPT